MMHHEKLTARLAQIVAPSAFLVQLAASYCGLFLVGNKVIPRSLIDISEKYATRLYPQIPALPAAWTIIFFFQLIYISRLFLSDERRKDADIVFPITCALNTAWIVCFVYEKMAASLAVFALNWVILAGLWLRLNVFAPPARTFWNFVSLLAPFSLYLGWITFDLQLNVSSVVQLYRGSPFSMTDIIISIATATVFGWIGLALVCDLVLCVGVLSGFAALLYRAHAVNDRDLLFVTAVAISSLSSAAIVRLATSWLRTDRRPKRQATSSIPLEARFIEA